MAQPALQQQRFALVLLDVMAYFGALHVAVWLRYSSDLPFGKGGPAPWKEIFWAFPIITILWVLVATFTGAYKVRQNSLAEASSVIRATFIAFVIILAASFFYREFTYSRAMIGFFIPLALVSVLLTRVFMRVLRRHALSRFAGRSRVALLGESAIGSSLIRALKTDAEYYDIIGRVLLHDTEHGAEIDDDAPPILGGVHELDRICETHQLDMLILVNRTLPEATVLSSIEICLRHQVNWTMIPAVHELLLDRARVDIIDGIPLVGMRRTSIVGFNWMVKRLFDIVASSLLLLLSLPLMLLVALGIKLSSKGPIFYTQERVGFRGQVFPFFKFRSMHADNDDTVHREYTKQWIQDGKAHSDDGDGEVHKIANDPRVFGVGRFIRKYSVDELPQLLNVLRGEMSLIGPRPALAYEVDVYREWHRRRFEAPPGITGLWQVSGRNRLSFEEMIKLDIDYLENWSLLLDIQILWRTIRVVLFEHAY